MNKKKILLISAVFLLFFASFSFIPSVHSASGPCGDLRDSWDPVPYNLYPSCWYYKIRETYALIGLNYPSYYATIADGKLIRYYLNDYTIDYIGTGHGIRGVYYKAAQSACTTSGTIAAGAIKLDTNQGELVVAKAPKKGVYVPSVCAYSKANNYRATSWFQGYDKPDYYVLNCATNDHCAGNQYCDRTSSDPLVWKCVNQKSNGESCSFGNECVNYCVDHVCCNSACSGTCKSCDQPGNVGTCITHAEGTDPDNECSPSSWICNPSDNSQRRRIPGTCDGDSAKCEQYEYGDCGSGKICYLDTCITNPDTDATACADRGYAWTGNYCCGWKPRYYNDDIGCWLDQSTENGELVLDYPNVLNYDGQYYGCNIAGTDVANIQDEILGGNLIIDQPFCTQIGDYFCSHHNNWSNEPQSTHPNDPNMDALQIDDTHQKACINEEWLTLTNKSTWDDIYTGYCLSDSDCLVDQDGNFANNHNVSTYDQTHENNPQCISDEQFIEDHYCKDEGWTSRTRLLALELLNLAESKSNNYVIYCDTPNLVLNDYTYTNSFDVILGPKVGADPLSRTCSQNYKVPCVNNFCVLTYDDDKTILAASLNREINGIGSILSAFENIGTEDCNNVGSNADFTQCSSTSRLQYSGKLNSIIYSETEPIPPYSTSTSLKGLFMLLISWVSGEELPEPSSVNTPFPLAVKTKDYNRIYLRNIGSKNIIALVEAPQNNVYLGSEYINLDSNLCATTDNYVGYGFIDCIEEGNVIRIASNNPDKVWQKLASRLRLKD